ncbi:MAG: metal-sensitive transcriptional regulator [Chloroflexota bacterium]|nr:metal-sensitive transcriptional regulator [Chloroflexota bacterium]
MMEQEEVITRLRKVEGQVRGLQRMVKEQQSCEALITQLMAARSALDKVAVSIVTDHLGDCLTGPDPQQRAERILNLVFPRYAGAPLGEEGTIEKE